MKSGRFRDCVFRAGLCHNLPDDLAQALIDARWAYPEGEEPPFDEETLAIYNAPYEAQAAAEQSAAVLRHTRAQTNAKKARELQVAEEATEHAMLLRAARAAKKGGQ
jgi:hypothetical protein